jgi:hypothetical protein
MKTFFPKNPMEISFVLSIVGKGKVDSEYKVGKMSKKHRHIELFFRAARHIAEA